VTDPEDRFLAEPTDSSVDKAAHPETAESAYFYDAALAAIQRRSDPDEPASTPAHQDQSADPYIAMSTPGSIPSSVDITIPPQAAATHAEAFDTPPTDAPPTDAPYEEASTGEPSAANTSAPPVEDTQNERPSTGHPLDAAPEAEVPEAEVPEAEAPEAGSSLGDEEAGSGSYDEASPASTGPVAGIGDGTLAGEEGFETESFLAAGPAEVSDHAVFDRDVLGADAAVDKVADAPPLREDMPGEDGSDHGVLAPSATDLGAALGGLARDGQPGESHPVATSHYVDSDRADPDATVAGDAVPSPDAVAVDVPPHVPAPDSDGAEVVQARAAGEDPNGHAGPTLEGAASDSWDAEGAGTDLEDLNLAAKGVGGGSAEGAAEPDELDSPERLRAVVEAILLVMDTPTEAVLIAQVLERPVGEIEAALGLLRAEYDAGGRGMDLREVAGGWRLYTREDFAGYIERFVLEGQQTRLTQAALETLAVIAYRQPITRSRVSAIRGVNVDAVMRTLLTRGLVEECGSDTETGGGLYRTTAFFLERLGISSLDELPSLAPLLPDTSQLDDVALST
jgi:segregation and condensation protein B